MLQFILRRLGLVIPTFIGITLLTFAFVHMIPGDPVLIMAGESGVFPVCHAQFIAPLGLGDPPWEEDPDSIHNGFHCELGVYVM